MTRLSLIPAFALVALVSLAACGGEKAATADTTAAAPSEVQRAAAVAEAVRSAPTKTDSILMAHGLTADELEQMMYRIAADSAQSAEYRRLTGR